MANAQEFAKQLGITKEGSYENGEYIITLEDSNEYSRMYTLLDKSELLDLDAEEVNIGVDSSIMVYYSDDFDVKLLANFDKDSYMVTFKEA